MKDTFLAYQSLLERAGDLPQKREDHCRIIDQFYDDQIIQMENNAAPIVGKAQLLALENKNLDSVTSVTTKIEDVVFDEDSGTVWGRMTIYFNTRSSGRKKLEEAFQQHWLNGKIVYQRFYYGEAVDDF